MYKLFFYKQVQKFLGIGIVFAISISVLDYNRLLNQSYHHFRRTECVSDIESHRTTVDEYYEKRRAWQTSHLGTILFKNILRDYFDNPKRHEKTYMILMWRFWPEMQKLRTMDALEDCNVKNCMFTNDDRDINRADAVVIHMQRSLFPKVTKRNVTQRWILLNEESPMTTYILEGVPTMKHLTNIFNWTMTYRSDSDIPIPAGRTLALTQPQDVFLGSPEEALKKLVPHWDLKQYAALAAAFISDCTQTDMLAFLIMLRKYMKVDIHGSCLEPDVTSLNLLNLRTEDCQLKSECKLGNEYIFYLVLEIASCRHYMTEKIFFHGYSKGAIPVIMGIPFKDCENLLPPNSFLHMDNFKTPLELTTRMLAISAKFEEILKFHSWRKHFKVVNEHGHHDTIWPLCCRVCEALNVNDGEIRMYDTDELRLFFNKKLLCDFKFTLNPSTTTKKPEPPLLFEIVPPTAPP